MGQIAGNRQKQIDHSSLIFAQNKQKQKYSNRPLNKLIEIPLFILSVLKKTQKNAILTNYLQQAVTKDKKIYFWARSASISKVIKSSTSLPTSPAL